MSKCEVPGTCQMWMYVSHFKKKKLRIVNTVVAVTDIKMCNSELLYIY